MANFAYHIYLHDFFSHTMLPAGSPQTCMRWVKTYLHSTTTQE